MAVVEVSSEQLLKAVVQLPQPELEQFLEVVLRFTLSGGRHEDSRTGY